MAAHWLVLLLLVGLANCHNNASSRRAYAMRKLHHQLKYPIHKDAYLYLLDIEQKYSSVLLDYGMYNKTTRSLTRYNFYLASTHHEMLRNRSILWEVRKLTDDYERFSSDLTQQINKRLAVPLNSNIETEIKLIVTIYGKNYSTPSVYLSRPQPVDWKYCKIVNVSSSSLDAHVTWDNPPTSGLLRITGNKFGYERQELTDMDYDLFTAEETYSVKYSTDVRTYEKLLPGKQLPSKDNSAVLLAVETENVVGTATSICKEYAPQAPWIEVQKLGLTDGDPLSKDYTFTCVNKRVFHHGDIEDLQEMQVYQNWFERRDKGPFEWSSFGDWYRMSPSTVPVEDVFELHNTYTFASKLLVDASQFRAKARSAIGASPYSNVVTLYGPRPPMKLKLVWIGINEEEYSKRDFELEWENPPNSAEVNPMLRNILQYREIDTSEWTSTTLYIHDSKVLRRYYNLTDLPAAFYQFRVKVENYLAISHASNVVTFGPIDPIILKDDINEIIHLEISESNTEEKPTRDYTIRYKNPNHGLNKVRKLIFQYRSREIFYSLSHYEWLLQSRHYQKAAAEWWDDLKYNNRHWGSWTDTEPIKVDPDAVKGEVQILDIPAAYYSRKFTALQWRVVALGYVGKSDPSGMITIVKPSHPTLRFIKMYLIEPRSEEEYDELIAKGLLYDRIFEFEVRYKSTFRSKVNKIRQLVFEYRVSEVVTGPTQEAWQTSKPIEIRFNSYGDYMEGNYNVTVNFKKSQYYVAVEFRALYKALIGTGEPGSIATLEVPSAPSELNYIYYGSDVRCKPRCELELDWRKSAHGGTLGVSQYVIQHQPRGYSVDRWVDLVSVPETGLSYRRQFIVMEYEDMYRVVARNILGDSRPSNVIWELPFHPYHLRVDYRRDPVRPHSVIITLTWDWMGRYIDYYIAQTNLFFLHDTRAMTDVRTVDYRTRSVEYSADIKFLDYTKLNQHVHKFYLPEFRVISKYGSNEYGPTSCTTFFHFSLDEFNSRDSGFKGYMP